MTATRRAGIGRAFRRALALAALGACVPAAPAQEWGAYYGDPIPAEIESAYVRGLNHLARSQKEDGDWADSEGNGPAVAAFAVLAIMAHGADPNFGPYRATIRKALGYLLANQRADNGYIGRSMYHHGFATLALAESYGVVNDPKLGPALRKAVDLILTSQRKNPMGAWRYSPESSDADTTVSGAQMVALMAARNAGLAIPDEAVAKGLAFYRQCQGGDGGIGYTGPDSGNGPRPAIATLAAALAKEKDSKLFKGAWRFLRENGESDAGGYFFYYLYYAAQAYFHADAGAWREWNKANAERLLGTQSADGEWLGPYGGTFCTSTALLSLALNYRFLPIYER